MITPPSDPGSPHTCDEHPDFAGDQIAAADHLRTEHSELWKALCGIEVERHPLGPVEDDRPPGPVARRRRTPGRHSRRR